MSWRLLRAGSREATWRATASTSCIGTASGGIPRLRHSTATHLGEAEVPLQAKSRHQHLSSLGRYVRLGEDTSARITAEHDPAARRRKR